MIESGQVRLLNRTLPVDNWKKLAENLHGNQQVWHLDLSLIRCVIPNGAITNQLPNELIEVVGTLPSLKCLLIYGSYLSGDQFKELCKGLVQLPLLKQLDLEDSNIGENGRYITQAINALPNQPQLSDVNIKGCNIPSAVLSGLLKALATRCRQLETLVLSENDIGGYLKVLTSQSSEQLSHLRLDDCKLTPADIHSLADAVKQKRLPRLKTLSLEDNPKLAGHMSVLFVQSLPHLNVLSFSGCNMMHADGNALVASIKESRLPQLETLSLMENRGLGRKCVNALLEAALSEYPLGIDIYLTHCVNTQFEEECKRRCEGTDVNLVICLDSDEVWIGKTAEQMLFIVKFPKDLGNRDL